MDIRKLQLDKDLIFFDLETTGLNVISDRIVQFAGIKYPADGGEPVKLVKYINPQMPIPADSTEVHGITDEKVKNEPTFDDFADELFDFIGDSDLAGYNLARFDVPVLMEEFDRVGIRFRSTDRRVIDVQEIFYKMEPRTLSGALRFYRNEEMSDAHNAIADVEATIKVLEGQLSMYADTPYIDKNGLKHDRQVIPDVATLHSFTQREGQLDSGNRLRRDHDGEIVFNFGKHKGRRLKEVFEREPNYYRWIQDKEFSVQVKEFTKEVWEAIQ